MYELLLQVLVLLLMLMMKELDWIPRQETFSTYIHGDEATALVRSPSLLHSYVESIMVLSRSCRIILHRQRQPHPSEANVPVADHSVIGDRDQKDTYMVASQPCEDD